MHSERARGRAHHTECALRADMGRALRPASAVWAALARPVQCCGRPRQVERALFKRAELSFGPEAV
jgi:hypothetical protein